MKFICVKCICVFHSHLLLLSIRCCCSSVCPLCSTWKSHLHHLQFHPKMWVKNKVCYSFKVIAHHITATAKRKTITTIAITAEEQQQQTASVIFIESIFSVEKCLFGCVLLYHIRFVCISSPPKFTLAHPLLSNHF